MNMSKSSGMVAFVRGCFTFLFAMSTVALAAQYKGVVVEEVDNGGEVDGRTYRIYIELMNDSDAVHMVYGEATHPLEIRSSVPFFQSEFGGPLSSNLNKKIAKEKAEARFDSFLTIGALDNYDNGINSLLDLKDFDENGGAVRTSDGAWYCLPGKQQTFGGSSRKVLIMQLTSAGKISGKFSIMGRTAAGEVFHQHDVVLSVGK